MRAARLRPELLVLSAVLAVVLAAVPAVVRLHLLAAAAATALPRPPLLALLSVPLPSVPLPSVSALLLLPYVSLSRTHATQYRSPYVMCCGSNNDGTGCIFCACVVPRAREERVHFVRAGATPGGLWLQR